VYGAFIEVLPQKTVENSLFRFSLTGTLKIVLVLFFRLLEAVLAAISLLGNLLTPNLCTGGFGVQCPDS
jgi:hypothetical protein